MKKIANCYNIGVLVYWYIGVLVVVDNILIYKYTNLLI